MSSPVGAFVLLVVRKEWRPGRGLFWKPDSLGYTDKPEWAGVFPPDEAKRSDRAVAIDPDLLLSRIQDWMDRDTVAAICDNLIREHDAAGAS